MDIVSVTRVRRLKGIGHVNRVDDTGTVKKIFNSQPVGVRIRGRPRYRWRWCVWREITRNWKEWQ